MDEHEKKVETSLLQPREGAGKYWWDTFLRAYISDINRRLIKRRLSTLRHPPGLRSICSPIFDKPHCASKSGAICPRSPWPPRVQLILERDRRTRTSLAPAQRDGERLSLSCRSLVAARELGLPTEALLSPEETLGRDDRSFSLSAAKGCPKETCPIGSAPYPNICQPSNTRPWINSRKRSRSWSHGLTARPTRGPDAPRLIRFVGFATVFFDTDSDVSVRAEEEASGADASTSEAIPGVDKCSLRVAGFIEPAARPATPLPN